jgi:hypothetical protein
MSDGAKLWCFLLLIPFFLAIGHDLWANYYSTPELKTRLESFEIDPHAYQGSDLGYLLVTYTPSVYESARTMIGEGFWVRWIDPVLRLYTFVVALLPFMLFAIWLLISRIFDIWPFAGIGKTRTAPTPDMYENRNRGAQFKYKRR